MHEDVSLACQQGGRHVPVAFIGVASKIRHSDVLFPYGSIDILRLSKYRRFLVYPANLNDLCFLFMISMRGVIQSQSKKFRISGRDKDGQEAFYISMGFEEAPRTTAIPIRTDPSASVEREDLTTGLLSTEGDWQLVPVVFKDVVLKEPGVYGLVAEFGEQEANVGTVNFDYKAATPFSQDVKTAIEATPIAARAVRMLLKCKECGESSIVLCSLDKPEVLAENVIWYSEAPDEWACNCGKSIIPLGYIRQSLHAVLIDRNATPTNSFEADELYTSKHVEAVVQQYFELLDQEPGEQAVQRFIERNPLLWAGFHPVRVFVKPRVLGKYVADFALLDNFGVLTLVEIERPELKLFKANGHASAGLNHAFEQVRDWMLEFENNRKAVLDQLSLEGEMISNVKGLVVAGRSLNESDKYLQRFNQLPRADDIEFHTFDYLAHKLNEIARAVLKL